MDNFGCMPRKVLNP